MLRRLGDEIGAEEHRKARRGPACVQAIRPIYISVNRQLRGGKVSQEIAQSALLGGEVGLPWIMHVEADLVDSIGDVRAGKHQVLKGPSKAPEVSRISNRRPRLDRDLSLRVHRH
jgi:hypothetical protein